MDTARVVALKSTFDGIVHQVPDENVEYWLARELMGLLGYSRWENFLEAIKRAENACSLQKIDLSYHFRDVTKMANRFADAAKTIFPEIPVKFPDSLQSVKLQI